MLCGPHCLELLANILLHGFVCAMLWVKVEALGNGDLDPAEKLVLRQLFNATGGAHGAWVNSTGWRDSRADPCDGQSWFGIYHWADYQRFGVNVSACTEPDRATGWRSLQVLSLTSNPVYNYPGNGLVMHQATLMDGVQWNRLRALKVLLIMNNPKFYAQVRHFASITSLQQLWLGQNALYGTVPSLDALTQLRAVGLYGNKLTGSVPTFAAQGKLQDLELQDNFFTGTVPTFSHLAYVQRLSLANNDLTGTLPAEIFRLTTLLYLALASNRLTGTVPDLTALSALEELYLLNNTLTGCIPSLRSNGNLRVLALSDNAMTGTIPSDVGTCIALEELVISNNRIIGTLPDLRKLSALRDLYAGGNALTGTVPALNQLSMLQVLELSTNALTGTIPPLGGLTMLQRLFAANNMLVGTIPELVALTALQHLSLYGNSLAGTIPAVQQLTVLRQLLLHSNDLGGAVPPLPNSTLFVNESLFDGNDDTFSDELHDATFDDPAVTLFNNRLSCALPNAQAKPYMNPNNGLVAVVAFGNRFSQPAPAWIHNTTRDADFLFVPTVPTWVYIASYLGAGAAVFVAVALVVMVRARHSDTSIAGTRIRAQLRPLASTDAQALLALQRSGARALAILSMLALTVLLPIYASGANYYECGQPLMHLSLAYLEGSLPASVAAAIFVVVFVWASAEACRALAADVTSKGSRVTSGTTWGTGRTSWVSTCVYALTWLAATALLSAPTVFYVLSLYLPSDNVLNIGASTGQVLRRGVPLLLALINSVLLPTLTRSLVHRGWQRSALARDGAVLTSRLLVLARLLTMLVLPAGAVLILSEGCGKRWRQLWSVCRENNTFIEYNEKTGCSGPGCNYYISAYTTAHPSLTPQELCDADSSDNSISSAHCVRGVIEALAPLIAEKFAIAAFLQPALLLIFFEIGCAAQAHKTIYRRSKGHFRVGLDLEFSAALSQIELALVYGIVFPIVLPIAALSLAVHGWLFTWLLRSRGVPSIPCAAPPVAYLLTALIFQAALVAWFFGSVESTGVGVAVGILALLGALRFRVRWSVRNTSTCTNTDEQMQMDTVVEERAGTPQLSSVYYALSGLLLRGRFI